MTKHTFLISLFYCIISLNVFGQNATEFPTGYVLHAKIHNGMLTRFNSEPDQYTGGFQLVPQWTVVPGHWRIGLIAGAMYSAKKIEAQLGATMSIKLKNFGANVFGTAGNTNVSLDYIAGTGKQQLIGGGIHLDLFNKLLLGITAHRDVTLNSWWFQTSFGVRINKIKKIKEPFNE